MISLTLRRFFALIVALLIFGGLGSLPQTVRAVACECFCTSPQGSVSIGAFEPKACQASCHERKAQPVVCATSPASYPANVNLRCLTKQQCSTQGGVWGENQAPDCPGCDTKSDPSCTFAMRYCYVNSSGTNYTLNIPLGDFTQATDIGAYINLLYRFLIGAGIVAAVIMLMVGGLQYTLGHHLQSKAKARIEGAAIGLVLVLTSSLILGSVNPRLLRLDPPAIPMVRRIDALSSQTSCEQLKKDGYILDTTATTGPFGATMCGSVTNVLRAANGSEVLAGTTCQYVRCPDQQETCVGNGTQSTCLSCQEAVPGADHGLIPSANFCSRFGTRNERDDMGQLIARRQCFWTRDPDAFISDSDTAQIAGVIGGGSTALVGGPLSLPLVGLSAAGVALFSDGGDVAAPERVGAILSGGTCAEMRLNCAQIDDCADYDDVTFSNAILKDGRSDSNAASGVDELDPDGSFTGEVTIKSLCESDPCGIAARLSVKGETYTCRYNPDATTFQCDNFNETSKKYDTFTTGL